MGTKKKGKYTMSPAALAQKQNAWTKALEAKKVSKPGEQRKVGELKKPITDGYKHLKSLQNLTNCTQCAAKRCCPQYEELVNETSGEKRTKCPLWSIYRNAVTNVVQNPLMYLSQKAADLDIAIAQQKMIDAQANKPISKEMISATKVALEAVKIAQLAEKGTKRGRHSYGREDKDIVIDVEAFDVE